jgi:hypothetical protein
MKIKALPFFRTSRRTNLRRFQASAAKQVSTALFWVITQRVVVISYRRFGTTYRSHLQGSKIQNITYNEEASYKCVKVEPWAFYDGLIQISVLLLRITDQLYRVCVYVCQRSVFGLEEDGLLKRLYLTNRFRRRPNWETDLIGHWNDLWELEVKSTSSEHLLILSVDQGLKFRIDFLSFPSKLHGPPASLLLW